MFHVTGQETDDKAEKQEIEKPLESKNIIEAEQVETQREDQIMIDNVLMMSEIQVRYICMMLLFTGVLCKVFSSLLGMFFS